MLLRIRSSLKTYEHVFRSLIFSFSLWRCWTSWICTEILQSLQFLEFNVRIYALGKVWNAVSNMHFFWPLYLSYIYVWNIVRWLCSAGLVSRTVEASLEVQVKEWLKAVKSSWFSQRFHILPTSVVFRQVVVLFDEFPLNLAEISVQMYAWDVSIRVVTMRIFNFNIYFNTN